MKLSEILLKLTHARIYLDEFKNIARKKSTDFIRDRKMPFEDLMIFMLFSLKSSTASALRRFFMSIGKQSTVMTQQSLSEARKKLNVQAFIELFHLTRDAMTENLKQKWHGYRVYAIDGTKVALPSDKKLFEHYGGLGRNADSPTAQASALYDILNDIVVEAEFEPLATDERTIALRHIEALNAIAKDDRRLVILDRGYASFELIQKFEDLGINYLMRVKSKFNKDIDAQIKPDGYVWLSKGDERIHIRVIKFALDSGETETLITNIADRRLGKKAFKKLYFLRWPIEIKYDIVKNKLQLENFNTRTVEGVQQDFYAAMYLANFAAATAIDVQSDIDSTRIGKSNKYQYKANINELIGILKDRLVFALAQDDPNIQSAMLQATLAEVTRFVTPVRPERSTPRKDSPRKSKFHHNKKHNS